MRLALETAGDVDLPVAKALKKFYEKGIQAGLAEDDFIGAIRLLQGGNKIIRDCLERRAGCPCPTLCKFHSFSSSIRRSSSWVIA